MIDTKSASILLVLNVLREYSDENHYLTQNDIIQKIEDNEGITLERKTVKKYLTLLSEMGYDIDHKGRKGGVCLLSRELDQSQIQFLVDAIFSSKNITGKQAQKLSSSLYGMFSKYQRKKFNYLYKCEDVNRNSDSDFFLNIEIINEAIEQKKILKFQYAGYDVTGKEILRMNGYEYFVSPYYMVNNFGKYYLICHNQKHPGLTNFRIDFIRNMEILEDSITPLESLEEGKKFNIYDFINEHIYAFDGKVNRCKVLIFSEKAISYIVDWFGKKVEFTTIDGNTYAEFNCDEQAFYYWCLQYGQYIEIKEPESVIERLKENYLIMSDRYPTGKNTTFPMSIDMESLMNNFLYHHLPSKVDTESIKNRLIGFLDGMLPIDQQPHETEDAIIITNKNRSDIIYVTVLDDETDFESFLHKAADHESRVDKNNSHHEMVFLSSNTKERLQTNSLLYKMIFKEKKIAKEFLYSGIKFKHNYVLSPKKVNKETYYFEIKLR
jgi:predicted DNA-binding transcriptional regulator YafY